MGDGDVTDETVLCVDELGDKEKPHACSDCHKTAKAYRTDVVSCSVLLLWVPALHLVWLSMCYHKIYEGGIGYMQSVLYLLKCGVSA